MRGIWAAILVVAVAYGEVATEIKKSYDDKIKSLFKDKTKFKIAQSSPFIASDEANSGVIVEAIIDKKARIGGVWCGVGEMCAGRILNEVGDDFVVLQDGFNKVRVYMRRSREAIVVK